MLWRRFSFCESFLLFVILIFLWLEFLTPQSSFNEQQSLPKWSILSVCCLSSPGDFLQNCDLPSRRSRISDGDSPPLLELLVCSCIRVHHLLTRLPDTATDFVNRGRTSRRNFPKALFHSRTLVKCRSRLFQLTCWDCNTKIISACLRTVTSETLSTDVAWFECIMCSPPLNHHRLIPYKRFHQ